MAIQAKRRALLLILSIFLLECLEAKKFGGASSGSRGGSGGRMNPPPQQSGGGFGGHPQGGGFGGQQPHLGGGGPGGMQPNFRPGGGGGGFHSGGGMGSPQRSSAFKTALAGAAIGTVGGLLAFEAGKAIIHSFDRPFHYENRDYYWGPEYAKRRPDEHVCTYSFDQLIADTTPTTTSTTTTTTVASTSEGATTAAATTTPSPEQALAHATFPNGTRPKQIVWTCKNSETCCGTDCCPSPQSVSRADGSSSGGGGALSTFGKILLIITIVGLLLCCCCVAIAYKFCRSAFDSFMPRSNNANANNNQYDNDGQQRYDNMGGHQQQQQQPYYNNQAQSYPMQPYVGSNPGPNAYPQAPQPPAQYPAYPPAPGYYEGQKY